MRKRAFSIVEVMFAIMILGVGFILVAAMFPVAIQQSQANVDESTGRSVAMSGAVQTANAMRMLVLPADQALLTTMTGTIAEFRRVAEMPNGAIPVRDLVNSSSVYEGDPRFGWTSFYQYRYDAANATLKNYSVITVALRARNFAEQGSLVDAIGYSGYPDSGTANKMVSWQDGPDDYDNASVRCRVDFTEIAGTPGAVAIDAAGVNPLQADHASVEGAILIVRSHTTNPALIGRIYYLSQYDTANARWDLDPKSDPLPPTADLNNIEVYLIGRGLRMPNTQFDPPAPDGTGTNPREGLSQVVGVYRMTSSLP